jgi:hypothetical protein
VDVIFELVDSRKHDVLLKYVKATITGDARTKLMVRDLTCSWGLVKAILEENYATRRASDYCACEMFSARQGKNESIASLSFKKRRPDGRLFGWWLCRVYVCMWLCRVYVVVPCVCGCAVCMWLCRVYMCMWLCRVYVVVPCVCGCAVCMWLCRVYVYFRHTLPLCTDWLACPITYFPPPNSLPILSNPLYKSCLSCV